MKGALLFIIAAATLYVAGIYRAPAGMMAAVAEFLFFFIGLVSVGLLRRRLRAGIIPAGEGMERKEAMSCYLKVENPGRLPVWFWAAQLVWTQDGQTGRTKISGKVEGRGQERADFEVSAGHCGDGTVTVKQLRGWDYLRLFTRRVKWREGNPSRRIPVFPPRQVLQVESARGEFRESFGTDQTPLPLAGTEVQEVHQYREYKEGDSIKNVHWKLSARSEEMWVKEYSRANECRVGLFLDLVLRKPLDAQRRDAFYEILLALLLGLLARYDGVFLYWFRLREKAFIRRLFTEEEQYRELLAELYEEEWIPWEELDEKSYREEIGAQAGDGLLQLDSDLRLSYGGAETLLLKRFSEDGYERELAEQRVVIP